MSENIQWFEKFHELLAVIEADRDHLYNHCSQFPAIENEAQVTAALSLRRRVLRLSGPASAHQRMSSVHEAHRQFVQDKFSMLFTAFNSLADSSVPLVASEMVRGFDQQPPRFLCPAWFASEPVVRDCQDSLARKKKAAAEAAAVSRQYTEERERLVRAHQRAELEKQLAALGEEEPASVA
jgi:hypothetical protein